MDTKPDDGPLQVGTYVKILDSNFDLARIVEYRGPLGPGGMRIYRLRVRRDPKPLSIEVGEDQIEVIPSTASDATPKSL